MARKFRVADPGLVPHPVELPDVKNQADKAKDIKDVNGKVTLSPISKKP